MEFRNDSYDSNVSLSNNMMLCDAAVKGDVALLRQLLQKDPSILHRPLATMAMTSFLPLHVACRLGRLHFVTEILRVLPDLSDAVDPYDQSSTPLHLAARNGHVDLVKYLVMVNPSVCFARDSQGMNPVHVAVARNSLAVLEELTGASPTAARERVVVQGGGGGRGDTILHLCVKQGKLEGLQVLVEKVGDEAMINAGDGDGNTILHLAVINKKLEIVEFLLDDRRTNRNAINTNGMTPMDIIHSQQQPHSLKRGNELSHEIKDVLKRAKATTSIEIEVQKNKKSKYFGSWIEHQSTTLMVVASLIATMAFQAGINPPGGVVQEDSRSLSQSPLASSPEPESSTTAGTSVMASHEKEVYIEFFILNSIGFMSSMASILLLISGFSCKKFLNFIVTVLMWAAITAMAIAYLDSWIFLTPNNQTFVLPYWTVLVWFLVMLVLLGCHFIQGLVKLVKRACRLLKRLMCFKTQGLRSSGL